MVKYKAYIAGYQEEKDRIKINIRVYDSDLPSQWLEVDPKTQVEETVLRPEYPIDMYIPYGQSDDYIRTKVSEEVRKFGSKEDDLTRLKNLKNSNEQIE